LITKVRNLRQATEYDSNFEQDILNTTGLTFAFFAGETYLGNSLVDVAAGTVTVPVGDFVIWLDVTTVTVPAMKATNVPGVAATDSIILYTGTSTTTDIDQSTVVDHRSFTTGHRGPSASVSDVVQTQDPEEAPGNAYWVMRSKMATWDDVHQDWNTGGDEVANERQTVNLIMDDAAAPLRAIGVANDDYTITGSPGFGEVGPTFLTGQSLGAMSFDGTNDYITIDVNTFSAALQGVIWGWFYTFAAGAGGGRQIIAQSNAASSVSCEVLVSGANKLSYNNFTTTSQYRLDVDPTPSNDTWHFVTIVQRADTNGVQITLDGVLYNKDTGNTTETLSGTGSRDDFYSKTWNALGRQGRYAARGNTSASFKWEGRLYDVGIAVPNPTEFPLVWSAANVAKLHRCAGF
jgi:hypothetical protein